LGHAARLHRNGVIPPAKIKLTIKTNTIPPVFYLKNGKIDAAKFANLLERGVSVVTDPIEIDVPPMSALCADIAARTGEPCITDVIVTIGSGGALKRHFDSFDVAILQVEGSKRWRIYDQPVVNPIKGMPEQKAPESVPAFGETLQAGDFLYMPGGYWHHCDNAPDRSLHLAVGFVARTGWHAVKALVPKLLAEEMFRTPLTRFRNPAEKAAYETALKKNLIKKIEQMSIADFLAESKESGSKAGRMDSDTP
jgi:ribosomal protein L16 Arg81 hydroxylase